MKKILIPLLIFLTALVLRFYDLGGFRCLNWDEASFGYNAYSILTTGKDEYGTPFPLQFKSVGDYKAPLYIYLMVPVIKVLGLNNFSVRFLPALLGSISVVIFYLLVRELFDNRRLALLSSLFLAISPWSIQFTRAGADVGISTFFTLAGIYGFIKGAKGARWGYFLTAAGFSGAMYAYFADRLFVPVISVFLAVYYRKEIVRNKKNFILAIVLGILMMSFLTPSLVSGGHEEKILKTTIFGYLRSEEYLDLITAQDHSKIFYYLYHTSIFENAWTAAGHYLNHFSPTFLFFKGVAGDPRQFINRMGIMYLWDLPLIVIGITALFAAKGRAKYLIFGWLLLAPIPASITKDQLSARRSLEMVYPLIVMSAYGVLAIWEKIRRRHILKEAFLILAVMTFGFGIGFYLISYYVLTPPQGYAGPAGWSCGYKELVDSMEELKGTDTKIVVDTSYQGPYIFFLFYQKYDPARYQPQARLIQDSAGSLGEGAGYDNYIFRPIYWPRDRCILDTVFAGPASRLPDQDLKKNETEIMGKIYFPDGTEAFRIVKTVNPPPGDHCRKMLQARN